LDELKTARLDGLTVSAGMLNALLSGSAERGDIDRVMQILAEFPRHNVSPDADSFSFALEGLGKHLARRKRNPAGPELMESCLNHANSFLTMMEDSGIAPTRHIIRDYVELLCRAGDVTTATNVIKEESTSPGPGESVVCSKAIYCVAMANVREGRLDSAREIASWSSEPMPYLLEKIDREQLEQNGEAVEDW